MLALGVEPDRGRVRTRCFRDPIRGAFVIKLLLARPLRNRYLLVSDFCLLAVAGVLLVWSFVFDAAFTFLRRLRHRENVFAAHRSHLYQRLVIAGYRHRTVTLLYIGLAAAGAILALLWTLDAAGSGLASVLSIPLLCLGLCVLVWRRESLSRPL